MKKSGCRECVYWEPLKNNTGRCHCGHPTSVAHLVPKQNVIGGEVQLNTIETTSWPVTKAEMWCGEFK